MLKITKGLKKKKKGKKSKRNKEEELFKPEELEAYRREHQQQASAPESAAADSDEWKTFQALTAGVDSVLRKTQGDLDRIKSTSFFQRVPPPSEANKSGQAQARSDVQQEKDKLSARTADDVEKSNAAEQIGVVPVSESESEEDDEEEADIFDTSFVDAVASGEVKLAYIPESPTTEEPTGEDPFDTSIAERAILGPAYNKKGKKLVPLGAAVEVLTGRVEQVTCATKRPVTRRVLQQNLLLGSFDLDDNGNATETVDTNRPEVSRSLLDDDSIPLSDAPVDLSGASLYQAATVAPLPEEQVDPTKQLIEEFDSINKTEATVPPTTIEDDDEDDEFALLAAESAKKVNAASVVVPADVQEGSTWDTFDATFDDGRVEFEPQQDLDPFDTTFAENILPGKAELKIIESEILNAEIEEIQTSVEDNFAEIIKSKVSIHVTNPTGERESISSLDRIDEFCLTSLQTIHRDLLGGSNTDLSKIGDDPITPNQPIDDSFSDYSDPFDTSIVEQVVVPGQAELKFIEKEILGDVTIKRNLSDPDFNPREQEEQVKPVSRPDILEVNTTKTVVFSLPSPSLKPDLLATDGDEGVKHTKPLTPYYVRENSIPEPGLPENNEDAIVDPFDTSFVAELAPGKAELKLIESEFIKDEETLSDNDFDPRKGSDIPEKVSAPQASLPKLTLPIKKVVTKIDLLAVGEEVTAKVLTPAVETVAELETSYSDPFDTSIASNILPGKTELKLIEDELISQTTIKRNLTDPDFDPRTATNDTQEEQGVRDLLDKAEEQVSVKPLTPTDYQVCFEIGDTKDIDPFDTSAADNLVPGKAELKVLESELI